MISRPAALGHKVDLATPDDVDAALHEMAWLTVRQRAIEAPGKAQAEEIKRATQAKLVVEVEGEPLTFSARWETLQAAVFRWCEKHLKKHLPPNKKSLKLSHGELKSRTLVAAVAMREGRKADEAARQLASAAGVLDALEMLLETKLHGVALEKLLAVKFELNKDGIKSQWERPEIREFLEGLSISVEAGTEQFTIVPADLQLTND